MNLQKNTDLKRVIIVGGGVAGLSAARYLGRHHVNVHLVEKSETLGGNAGYWACMATDTCKNCGACLSREMSDSLRDMAHVTLHLNQTVTSIQKQDRVFQVILDDTPDKPLTGEKLILASGMSPIRPDGLLGQACESHQQVITTNQLNHIMRSHRLDKYLQDTPSPKISFLQCVGSRNREKGRDYCSQICCKISLRHINKLLHLYPDAEITMFYMDLQVIGKEARKEFDALSKNVRLIQGVPAEILDNKEHGKLTLIHEDSDAMARTASHFDMIVLSVGMEPAGGIRTVMDNIDTAPDNWGFYKTDDDVYVAGCASGPKDIITSIAEGKNCAHQIISSLSKPSHTMEKDVVAVIGDGPSGNQTAAAVSSLGYEVWVFGSGPKQTLSAEWINYVPESEILSVDGQVNQYTLTYSTGNQIFSLKVNAIVMAMEQIGSRAGSSLGISSERLHSLCDFNDTFENHVETIPEKLVFWQDYSGPEPKASSRQLLLLADKAARLGRQVIVLMTHALVHGMEGQSLYDRARKNGVKFWRISAPEDIVIEERPENIWVTAKETSLKGEYIRVDAHWLIIPDRLTVDPEFDPVAGRLKEPLDAEGLLQSPNVRHRLTGSFRKGLFYTGTGHSDMARDDLYLEILNICAGIQELTMPPVVDPDLSVRINEKNCAKCLTCLRVCPHSAIKINNGIKPFIVPEACFSCGLCSANCPALAIEKADNTDSILLDQIKTGQTVVFACQRSAALAAADTSLPENIKVLAVPCACRISKGLVIKSLIKGAEKVVLAGCHEGNCQSDEGHSEAGAVADAVNRIPGMGEEPKVVWQTVAANESQAFLEMIEQS